MSGEPTGHQHDGSPRDSRAGTAAATLDGAGHPLKIGLVSPYDYAVHGGVNDHIKALGAEFKRRGHDVRVIAPCTAPEAIQDQDFIPMGRSVPVPSGGSIARVSLSIWLRRRIKKLLQEQAFDIVHLHEPMAGFVTLNMLREASSTDAAYVGTFHTNRGTPIYRIGGTRLARRYFRRLHGRIAVSQVALSFISRHLPGDYRIIPNGIDVNGFFDAEPFPHLMDGKTNILFLGRLEKRKGLKYLLSAFSNLKWDWPELRLIVVGGGKLDDDSHRILGGRNLQDVVFAGTVSDEDRARYYRSADIFCSPATGKESFGIVLLEAMAAGKPVVVSDIEGYSNVVTHGREGLLVEPKNDVHLAEAIATLLREPDLRRRLAMNGRKRAEEFRWEEVAGQVLDYYGSCLSVQRSLSA